MRSVVKGILAVLLLLVASAYPQAGSSSADAHMVAKIREEGFQRSQVMDMAGYTAGCAVALEAARILKVIGVQPRRTIRVALWGGEEQGLHGSRGYVLKHFGNPRDPKVGAKPEYEKFSVYFNQDYGAGAFRGINLQGNEFVRAIFAAWMEPLRDLGFTAISIQSVGSTDHVSFHDAGLPGFQFIQDRIPGTAGHTNLDFLDTLQAEDLMKNAVIMAVFAYQAALSSERMPRKTIR